MCESIRKSFVCVLALIIAAASVGYAYATESVAGCVSEEIHCQMTVIKQAVITAEKTLNSEFPNFPDMSGEGNYITNIVAISDIVYVNDYADIYKAADDDIASVVEDYKAEQERIAAEKAAQEAAAKRLNAISPGAYNVTAEKASRPGMVGRLYIPSIDMTPVACFDSYQQSVCDDTDSACMYHGKWGIIIADHVHQNFAPLKKVTVGTIATLDCGDATYTLECIAVNEKFYLGGKGDFNDAFGLDDLKGYIVMYTCNGWPNVTATLWKMTSGGSWDSLYERAPAADLEIY